jgi:hypothetical protein
VNLEVEMGLRDLKKHSERIQNTKHLEALKTGGEVRTNPQFNRLLASLLTIEIQSKAAEIGQRDPEDSRKHQKEKDNWISQKTQLEMTIGNLQ